MENGNSKLEAESSQAPEPGSNSNVELPVLGGLPEDRSNLKFILIAAAAIVVVVAIAIVYSRMRPSNSTETLAPTPEQKAYFSNIEFSGAKMSAATNFLNQRVIYLDAEVANRGARAVKQVEVQMEFTDVMGQVILRDRARIFPPAALPLKAGETRPFQLYFDNMPGAWNQAPPRMTTLGVEF